MKLLVINGVDLTTYISLNGFTPNIDDADASAERSLSGSLTRDRVARIPNIEVKFVPQLRQSDVETILACCRPEKFLVSYYNSDTGRMEQGYFYAKIKYPTIKTIHNNVAVYNAFSVNLHGFDGVNYD